MPLVAPRCRRVPINGAYISGLWSRRRYVHGPRLPRYGAELNPRWRVKPPVGGVKPPLWRRVLGALSLPPRLYLYVSPPPLVASVPVSVAGCTVCTWALVSRASPVPIASASVPLVPGLYHHRLYRLYIRYRRPYHSNLYHRRLYRLYLCHLYITITCNHLSLYHHHHRLYILYRRCTTRISTIRLYRLYCTYRRLYTRISTITTCTACTFVIAAVTLESLTIAACTACTVTSPPVPLAAAACRSDVSRAVLTPGERSFLVVSPSGRRLLVALPPPLLPPSPPSSPSPLPPLSPPLPSPPSLPSPSPPLCLPPPLSPLPSPPLCLPPPLSPLPLSPFASLPPLSPPLSPSLPPSPPLSPPLSPSLPPSLPLFPSPLPLFASLPPLSPPLSPPSPSLPSPSFASLPPSLPSPLPLFASLPPLSPSPLPLFQAFITSHSR
ncbi:hypothetical protein C7M84_000495 [Penaeus vannamei]|uniref:Uncharacterized protein n=1 Tax=Penaeus vannamei TaxID=6689 RepID=A0A3R7PB94_PENVA|nr:hypothetical protein C7M84_000495 [Penaeus vannamei]